MMRSVFILSIVLCSVALQAQVVKNLGGQRAGISALTFLKPEISPKADALAGAQISQEGDAYAAHWNPAAMTDLEHLSFAVSNKLLPAGVYYGYASAILPTDNYSAWGLSAQVLSSGEMMKRTAFEPQGTGEYFSALNLAIGLSFAKQLSDRFSFGGTIKYIREQLAELSANTAVVDLGFLYRTDVKDLRFAVDLQSFGPNSSPTGDLPTNFFGSGSTVSLERFPPPTVFKLGVSMVPYKNDRHKLTVAAQLNHPNDNAENLAMGADFEANKLFSFRAGYYINVENQKWPVFGIGLRSTFGGNPLHIDYAAMPTANLGLVHNIGLSVSINKQQRSEE